MSKKLTISIGLLLIVIPFLYQNCAPAFDSAGTFGEANINSENGLAPGTDPDAGPGLPPVTPPVIQPPTGSNGFPNYTKLINTPNFRLLSNREIKNSLEVIASKKFISFSLLPYSSYDPFDNDEYVLSPNSSLVEKLAKFAPEFGKEFSSTSELMSKYFTCSTLDNNKCLEDFISKIGLSFFRRSLTSNELNEYMSLVKSLNSSLEKKKSAEIVTQTMVQDPNFLYKWELGSAQMIQNDGVTFYSLNIYEYISRVSYFLTGAGPSIDVLLKIKNGQMKTNAEYSNYVSEIQKSEFYKRHMMHFFGHWLGFAGFGNDPDESSIEYHMFEESSNLVYDSIFKDNKDWTKIFKSKRTYISKLLADKYQLPHSGGAGQWEWANYKRSDQIGILAHLSFLSRWTKRGDTNTTQRGYHLFKRLFCGISGEIPNGVDVDKEPGGDLNTPCKIKKVEGSLLAKGTACYNCHKNMDKLAFGLENYDFNGRYVTQQPGEPSCQIRGEGYVESVGQSFQGIKGLVDLGFSTEQIPACMTEHLLEYGIGLTLRSNQLAIISKSIAIQKSSTNFEELIKNIVLSGEFKYSNRSF